MSTPQPRASSGRGSISPPGAFATKLSLAGGVGIVFPVLAGFGFDPAAAAEGPARGLTALAVAYAWVPIAAKLASIALMWNFPLDEAAQKSLRTSIESA